MADMKTSTSPLFLTAVHDRLNISSDLSLPKLVRKPSHLNKLNQSYSVSSVSDLAQAKHSTRWDSFLNRNAKQEALAAIRERTEKEYDSKRRFPRALLSKIKSIETKKVVQPALSALDLQLLNMQKLHNRLHHSVMQKQAQLLLLSSELARGSVENCDEDYRLMQDCTYLNTLSALEREEKTQATLMHIIDREKTAVQVLGLPIAEMQEEIDKVTKTLQDATHRLQRIETKRQYYEQQAKHWETALKTTQKRKAEGVGRMLQSYSDQQLLLTHFEREEEAKRQVVTEKAKAQSLLALEYELELKLGDLYAEFNKKAEKLKRIESQNLGKGDPFKGNADMHEGAYIYMINYWMHLNTNSKHLQESSEQFLTEIETRTQERDSLKQTLTTLLETQDSTESAQQIAQMEELLSHRNREVELREINLSPLQRLEIAAINALSRVLYKVSEGAETFTTLTKVVDQVEFCASHLEKMLEEIIKASNLQRADTSET